MYSKLHKLLYLDLGIQCSNYWMLYTIWWQSWYGGGLPDREHQ